MSCNTQSGLFLRPQFQQPSIISRSGVGSVLYTFHKKRKERSFLLPSDFRKRVPVESSMCEKETRSLYSLKKSYRYIYVAFVFRWLPYLVRSWKVVFLFLTIPSNWNIGIWTPWWKGTRRRKQGEAGSHLLIYSLSISKLSTILMFVVGI